MITKEILQKRRKELQHLQGADIILLPANMESPMNCKDNCYPFVQDATFQYYFGMNHPNLIGVIDVQEKKEYIFGKDFSMDDIIWMGKDRKSTRLNSSHANISYAVFCLKKKNTITSVPPLS